MRVEEIAYHRNGMSGEGFWVARFTWQKRQMVAVLFAAGTDEELEAAEKEGVTLTNGRVAVLDVGLTATTIAFGTNSWYGADLFEIPLRQAIAENWASRSQPLKT